MSILGIPGAVLAGFAHFVLGSLLPLSYKNALEAGASAEQAAQMCMKWSAYMTLPDVLMIVLLYLPLLLILYMTARGRYGIPRRTLLINAAFIVLMVILQRALLHWRWVGILGAGESLMEGCVYINLIVYWSRRLKQEDRDL